MGRFCGSASLGIKLTQRKKFKLSLSNASYGILPFGATLKSKHESENRKTHERYEEMWQSSLFLYSTG